MRCLALDEAPLFAALSYAWGSAPNDHYIECDGKFIAVTSHLRDGLISIHNLQLCDYIWVDAICINQTDHVEKEIQVMQMRDIYQRAQKCIIWLGCPDQDSDATIAVENIKVMNEAFSKMTGPISHNDENLLRIGLSALSSPVWESLKALTKLSWFTRVWIIQEAALCQENVFLYGSTTFEWKSFAELCHFLIASNLEIQNRPDNDRSTYSATGTMSFIERVRNRLAQCADDGSQLVDLAIGSRYLQSSLKIDRVYGILGLLSLENRAKFQIDYSASAEARYWEPYVQYCKLCLDINKALWLLAAIDADGSISPFPSWCPDFSVPMTIFPIGLGYSAGRRASGPTLASNVRIDEGVLKIAGFNLDQVRQCSNTSLALRSNDLSAPALELALAWVEQSLELASSVFPNWNPDSLPEDFCAALVAGSANTYAKNLYESLSAVCSDFIRWLRWLTLDPDNRENWQPRVSQDAAYTYWISLWKVCRGRRLFTTKEGRFGIGPNALRSGDTLVTFFNASQCYVLREESVSHLSGKVWRLLGASYLHGMMDGEAFELYEDGKLTEQIFEIH